MATGLLFSGQGAQKVGMGRSLHDNSATARALYEEANAVLGYDLKKICFEGPEEEELTQTRVCQPALYVLGFAAAKILEERGKLADCGAALGLSLGELTALATAGVFDFATGLRLVAARAGLMQKACESTRGGMAALIGGDQALAEALAKECDIDVANLNCPGQIVVSGEADKVAKAAGLAKERGFKMAMPLKVAGAYHSRLMAAASAAYADVLKDAVFKEPRITVYTNVTGAAVRAPADIKDALVRQIVSSVRWEACQRAALAQGITEFYECGPGAVLAGFAKRIDKAIVIKPACESADLGDFAIAIPSGKWCSDRFPMPDLAHIRNFCIIAHVDHGKTTLSDRLLETTRTVAQREMTAQHLDAMDLERERGITIKCHPVAMQYRAKNGEMYLLNLIDTPGHVDFSYEVSRSLAACEGALLLVDASQGVEAQTVANAQLALGQNLTIIPVINKVDLPSARVEHSRKQIEDVLQIPGEDAILASGKAGIGIDDILEAIVHRLPPPRWADYPATRALVFDSAYDSYQGVICYVRMFSGSFKAGDEIYLMSEGTRAQIKEVGQFEPGPRLLKSLDAGCTGYVVTNIKAVHEVKTGDTLTQNADRAKEPLPGYKEVRPMVFSGLYPLDTGDHEKLKTSLAKLQLNDAALVYTSESSAALGFGFRAGFLGLLHMEIVQERIRREYDVDIISTYPSVVYRVTKSNGEVVEIDNPVQLPDPSTILTIAEPTIRATILTPNTCIGDLLALISEKRGLCDKTETLDEERILLHAKLPLNEILVDFNDRLKSITRGYGSMDYEVGDYEVADLVKLDILVNNDPVDAFASIVHRNKAEGRGRALCEKLKEILPQQLFKVAIQAAIGGKVVARETVSALRKDVTAKCYGGDITRKRKLLEKQKEGKKRMKQIGKVEIPQDAFVKILHTNASAK